MLSPVNLLFLVQQESSALVKTFFSRVLVTNRVAALVI